MRWRKRREKRSKMMTMLDLPLLFLPTASSSSTSHRNLSTLSSFFSSPLGLPPPVSPSSLVMSCHVSFSLLSVTAVVPSRWLLGSVSFHFHVSTLLVYWLLYWLLLGWHSFLWTNIIFWYLRFLGNDLGAQSLGLIKRWCPGSIAGKKLQGLSRGMKRLKCP